MSRRGVLGGLASMMAAPAIVHAGNLMPVKVMLPGEISVWTKPSGAKNVRIILIGAGGGGGGGIAKQCDDIREIKIFSGQQCWIDLY